MALALNTNLMALNASRNLGDHYSNLATSIRRLSSGLRVGMAADDAAGLAIRELMRADIAALNQGVRNANDAISLIQTADGALGVIDEKLIRMKELAEQAATGTYNSDQRIMIDSEFQAMKSEITRIAMATDFNGIKILCNDTANKLYIGAQAAIPSTPGAVTPGSAEVLYFRNGPSGMDVDVLNPDALTEDTVLHFGKGGISARGWTGDPAILSLYPYGLTAYDINGRTGDFTIHYDPNAANPWSATSTSGNVTDLSFNGTRLEFYVGDRDVRLQFTYSPTDGSKLPSTASSATYAYDTSRLAEGENASWFYDQNGAYPGMKVRFEFVSSRRSYVFDLDGDGEDDVRATGISGSSFSFGLGLTGIKRDGGGAGSPGSPAEYVTKIHFGTGNDSAEDYYYIYGSDCTADGLGIGDLTIETQEKAQKALEEIDSAIILKDKVRAYLGATQNRLENTIANLQTQAENIQAAESRISDVDVADEMTEFVRNQILSQAAVSMLAQANSMPQMVLSLMG